MNLQQLFSGTGRIRRTHFWLLSIGLAVIPIFFLGILGGMGAFDEGSNEALPVIVRVLIALFIIVYIAVNWISICLLIRRWHDRDKSGWWTLILFIPLVGPLWMLIECGFLDGTPGPNKYGPSPKGIGGDAPLDISPKETNASSKPKARSGFAIPVVVGILFFIVLVVALTSNEQTPRTDVNQVVANQNSSSEEPAPDSSSSSQTSSDDDDGAAAAEYALAKHHEDQQRQEDERQEQQENGGE